MTATNAALVCIDLVESPDDGDKWCARERTILWSLDATEVLAAFARGEALRVAHIWGAPPVVLEYLRTGDETLRAAARAAGAAARAAGGAAWDAAWAAHNARLEGMLMLAHGGTE